MARLHLTGGLVMVGPDGSFVEADLPGHQGRIALVALAVERRPISHDGLAEIVWDGSPPNQWKAALAAVVSKIRSMLSGVGLEGSATLPSAGGTYAFAPPVEIWIDLEHAMRSLDRAEGALRHDRLDEATSEATVASAILRRPLLPGADCAWLDEIRRRLQDAHYRSLIALADAWIRVGDHQLASVIAESAVKADPYRETGHRLLIEAHAGRGDSGAALRALRRCERDIGDDLGVRLSPATLELAARLRGG